MARTIKTKTKVAVGMSGGVDSSLAAHLLVEAGYDVTGVYLECWRAPGCRTEEDRKDALKVALSLHIPFEVLDFKTAYRERVVEDFFNQYQAGLTPNPDIACNKEIKFGLFYDWAMKQGFDYVATGHYAAITSTNKSDGVFLAIPKDTHKDQTYFLYTLDEPQLRHTLFPLANILKSDVRTQATNRHIHTAHKKDSVGICFIGDINVKEFLRDRLGENPGPVVDVAGNVIGTHQGLWFYTIGQRHGFTVDKTTLLTFDGGETISRHNFPPYYVVAKHAETNQLVVGFGSEAYRDNFLITKPDWITERAVSQITPESLLVRIRHTGQLIPATLRPATKSTPHWRVELNEAVMGIAPGQSAVFYGTLPENSANTVCLGGAQILQ